MSNSEFTPSIHQAVERKLDWLMTQSSPAKAIVGFINDCLGWQRCYGLPRGAELRAERFIAQVVSGEISLAILVEFATPVITQLAYIREGARERQLETPDLHVSATKEWWLDRTPGWAFA